MLATPKMPTYELAQEFHRDLQRLSPEQRRRFEVAVSRLVADLKAHRPPRAGLNVKRFQRKEGVYELTWAPDGRALFRYGTSPRPGDVHGVWLRIGGHDIFERP